MAYSIGGKVYTEHAMMDEVVHATKIILSSIVLKNSKLADLNETEESVANSDILLAINNGSARLSFIPLSYELLINFGYTDAQAKYILEIDHPETGHYDRSRVPEEDRDSLLEFACNYFVEHYEEENNYYRMLNGFPEYGSEDAYYVYIHAEDYPNIPDLAELVDLSKPVHLMNDIDYSTIESLGIMNDILAQYTDPEYRYLKYLGIYRIDIVFARLAKQWDILYIPNVQTIILDRFKELFQINRDIYLKQTYQLAYSYNSEYFDEMIMFLITCQTFADMIADLPEWYIRRDVFDLRTCQYFLESQGVEFFKEIPLKYQIRIVKNLNKLIRYKSTTKNVDDILEIFGMEDTVVYKYYIFKRLLREDEHGSDEYVDEYGNRYELAFVKTPLGESYDKYIDNNLNIEDYDSVTTLDKYWDGEDVHAYVKNEHLEKDFTIEGTKYMFIDTKVSMTEYCYQMSYFMNMILSSHFDFEDVQIPVYTIRPNTQYSLTNICILLYTLSLSFLNKSTAINYPITGGSEEIDEFTLYWDVNGYGAYWDPTVDTYDIDGGQMKLHRDPSVVYPVWAKQHYYEDWETDYTENYRVNVDGGFCYFSNEGSYTIYDWTKDYHPEWYENMGGVRIYSFNPNVDLEELEEHISGIHSDFDFDREKSYTLADFGVENFSTKSKFESVDEVLETYRNNTEAYNNLVYKIVYESTTHDKYLLMRYLFNNLFTVPYDVEFYRLKNGQLATDFTQILKERDYSLYKYYMDLMSEKDEETRKDNIRLALNDITDVLEYYIKSDDTKYVFSFVPTNSLDAINHYIDLMINFFKSWKVYFLDPHTTYVLDSRLENKVNMSDRMLEYKDKYWYYDKYIVQDAMYFNEKYYMEEKYAAGRKEVIDIYGYNQWWATDDFDFDGGYYDTEIHPTADAFDNNYTSGVDRDVDGGFPEWHNNPYWTVNGGKVSSRIDLYDLDGGGPLDMKEYVEIDGENVATGTGNFYPRLNDFTVPTYDVDGGGPDDTVGRTSTMISTIEGHHIKNDALISRYRFNDIQLLDDGLYLENIGVPEDEFEDLRDQILSDRDTYEHQLEQDLEIVRMINNPDYLKLVIDNLYANYFAVTKEVLSDFQRDATLNYCKGYTSNEVAALRNWFIELDLFGWDYF